MTSTPTTSCNAETTDFVKNQVINRSIRIPDDHLPTARVQEAFRQRISEDPNFVEDLTNDPELMESFLVTVIDPILDDVAYCLAMTTFFTVGDVGTIETYLRGVAASEYPRLSDADIEIVGEKGCASITRRLAQDIELVERLLESEERAKAYFRTTAIRLARELNKNNDKTGYSSEDPESAQPSEDDQEQQRRIEKQHRIVEQAIDENPDLLTPIELSRVRQAFQNKKNTEIAKDEGVNESAIRKSLKSATDKIAEHLRSATRKPLSTNDHASPPNHGERK